MKRIAMAFVIPSLVLLATSAAATASASIDVTRNIASMPLAFTANHGQWDGQVMFRASAGGATMWFTSDGATYQFTRRISQNTDGPFSLVDKRYGISTGGRQTSRSAPDDVFGRHHQPDSIESIAIKASFIGASPNPRMVGLEEMEYKCNYFIGNDPNKWHTDVPNYSAVVYEQIYDGIDLKYYGNGKQMEYDFIVSPGADFSQIQIRYEGAESVSINANGELVVETNWGEVVEQRPVIYQIDNSSRMAVAGEYKLNGDGSFGFELGSGYDPALPLVIDPVLSYSTYLGASGEDRGNDIVVDSAGSAYITGYTNSTGFPTEGPYQDTLQGSIADAFVTKLNSSGNALVYSTFLGGSSIDYGHGIAVDGSGNAYVTGITFSTDFPTAGAFQTNNGNGEAFVAKLNSFGNVLVYGTYLGGGQFDEAMGIAVDGLGNAYVTGRTSSIDFPTVAEYQTYQNNINAFVTKLNPLGDALVYSTYLGGNNNDYGHGIVVDNSGNAYVTGRTGSPDFPTQGAYQDTFQGLDMAFVTKLSSSGSALVYSTFLGGSSIDYGHGIAVNSLGNAYVTGITFSIDFPTVGEYQTFQGDRDAFVTKLNDSGNGLVYSTCLGGSGSDHGQAIAVDGLGNAYVTGETSSNDFPTEVPIQSDLNGGDAFVTKLSSSGDSLVYSTYLGGTTGEAGYGIDVDSLGNAYIVGSTHSTDFPITGEYQTHQGNWDAFVTKLLGVCCIGTRGDVNDDGSDLDIVDLTTAVDFLFGVTPPIPCPEESDVNGDGSGLPDIVDLTFIVDWLFGVAPTLIACP